MYVLGWSSPEALAVRLWTCAHVLPVTRCTWSEGMYSQRVPGMDTVTGPALASPHACCFVSWLLCCTHRRRPCFLLVAMQLHGRALSLHPRRSNWPALVAVANANALHVPLPPKPGWPVSPVFWVLCHGVGYLRPKSGRPTPPPPTLGAPQRCSL